MAPWIETTVRLTDDEGSSLETAEGPAQAEADRYLTEGIPSDG